MTANPGVFQSDSGMIGFLTWEIENYRQRRRFPVAIVPLWKALNGRCRALTVCWIQMKTPRTMKEMMSGAMTIA